MQRTTNKATAGYFTRLQRMKIIYSADNKWEHQSRQLGTLKIEISARSLNDNIGMLPVSCTLIAIGFSENHTQHLILRRQVGVH
jgi:hypothetical protein